MKKVRFFLVILVLLAQLAQAQSDTASKKFRFDFHGFVNPHYYADSREVVGGREDMMLFYPKPVERSSGFDINDDWNADLLSITARLNLKVSGPDILGAKTMAFVEGDFTGSTNASNNDLRLRHAYIQFDWGHSRLLAGQYWYPMVVEDIMPNTRPLNMGAPFHPYARYNQLRYTGRLKNWEAIAVAMYQQDNMSQGWIDDALVSSTKFQRRGGLPELHLQLRYNGPRLLVGAAANMLTIQPYIFTQPFNYTLYDSQWNWEPSSSINSTLTTFTYSIFLKYRWQKWALSAQTLLNNNLYEGCSMGGYSVITHYHYPGIGVPSDGVARYYKPWHFNTVWLDFGRTAGHWRPGIFVGYGRNMDDHSHTLGGGSTEFTYVGRGYEIEYLWRVQPRIGWHANEHFNIYAEAEYTFAQYYKKDYFVLGYPANANLYELEHDPNGGVGNLRLMLSAEYRW